MTSNSFLVRFVFCNVTNDVHVPCVPVWKYLPYLRQAGKIFPRQSPEFWRTAVEFSFSINFAVTSILEEHTRNTSLKHRLRRACGGHLDTVLAERASGEQDAKVSRTGSKMLLHRHRANITGTDTCTDRHRVKVLAQDVHCELGQLTCMAIWRSVGRGA